MTLNIDQHKIKKVFSIDSVCPGHSIKLKYQWDSRKYNPHMSYFAVSFFVRRVEMRDD